MKKFPYTLSQSTLWHRTQKISSVSMSDHHLSDELRLNSWQWTVTVWLHPLPGHTHLRIHIHEYAPSVLTAHTHLTSPSITHTPTRSPSFPLGDRLQVPCPPRGPRRALVRPGAIQAAPNTQLRVLCVSLTALVILFMWGKKRKKGGLQRLLLWRSWQSHKTESHLALMSDLKGYTGVFSDTVLNFLQNYTALLSTYIHIILN